MGGRGGALKASLGAESRTSTIAVVPGAILRSSPGCNEPCLNSIVQIEGPLPNTRASQIQSKKTHVPFLREKNSPEAKEGARPVFSGASSGETSQKSSEAKSFIFRGTHPGPSPIGRPHRPARPRNIDRNCFRVVPNGDNEDLGLRLVTFGTRGIGNPAPVRRKRVTAATHQQTFRPPKARNQVNAPTFTARKESNLAAVRRKRRIHVVRRIPGESNGL